MRYRRVIHCHDFHAYKSLHFGFTARQRKGSLYVGGSISTVRSREAAMTKNGLTFSMGSSSRGNVLPVKKASAISEYRLAHLYLDLVLLQSCRTLK